jgi:hypothetical protein
MKKHCHYTWIVENSAETTAEMTKQQQNHGGADETALEIKWK